ncbi:hypothetical protein Leryth_025990 [Lithospermum erythrorhizon]|nr:hypothetical protein Leryth_025990 [Lithospermum erythrorhizon]
MESMGMRSKLLATEVSKLWHLRKRFPKLHVYAYGPLPSVDFEVANACSEFVTSIVYDNEFSSRLSVSSILRLQAAAVEALSEDGSADSTSVLKLALHFMHHIGQIHSSPECRTSGCPSAKTVTFENDELPRVMEAIHSCECVSSELPEMYLPGLIIHIIPQENREPIWRRYTSHYSGSSHKAYLVKRDAFKDIVVSPYMFLDHLPWRRKGTFYYFSRISTNALNEMNFTYTELSRKMIPGHIRRLHCTGHKLRCLASWPVNL